MGRTDLWLVLLCGAERVCAEPPRGRRTLRDQAHKEAAGDVVEETKRLIKAAIEQAGGKPAFAQALVAEVQKRGAGTIPQTIKKIIARVVWLAGG